MDVIMKKKYTSPTVDIFTTEPSVLQTISKTQGETYTDGTSGQNPSSTIGEGDGDDASAKRYNVWGAGWDNELDTELDNEWGL